MNLRIYPPNPRYSISDCGRVFREGLEVRQTKTSEGYRTFYLSEQKKSELVHRAVVKSYIKDISSDIPVNHINGIKHDNRLLNLELSTISANNKHSRYVLGNSSGKYLRQIEDITLLAAVSCRRKYTTKEVAALLKIKETTLRSAISGKNYMYLREIVSEFMEGAIKYSLTNGRKIKISGKQSKYGMGVRKVGDKYYGRIKYLKKETLLGPFDTPKEAQDAYSSFKNTTNAS